MSRRWVVRGTERTVAGVLSELGEGASAVGEGRVFHGRRRVTSVDAAVHAGDEIVVHEAAAATPPVRVLAEWRGFLAVEKPAGLSTEADRRGSASLIAAVAASLGVPASELHAATRLDRRVSGVVVLAQGDRAKQDIAGMQRRGALRRRYVGLAGGTLVSVEGTFDDPIGHDARGRAMIGGRDARPARTHFRVVTTTSGEAPISLLAVGLETGRTHQIRLHVAHAGAPLLGDAEHGGPARLTLNDGAVVAIARVALHAVRVSVLGDGGGVAWAAEAPIPADLEALFSRIGGAPGALQRAATEPLSGQASPF